MGLALVPLLLATLLYEPTFATILQRPSTESIGPAFVWGSIPVLLTESQHTARVTYEVSKHPRLIPVHLCSVVSILVIHHAWPRVRHWRKRCVRPCAGL